MPEYHINCGLDEIYAGVLKKNSTEWRTKSPVTDEAINAVRDYLFVKIKDGDSFAVSGASGLAFSFMPVGIFILFVMGKKYGFGKLFRQVSFYLLMGIALPTAVISLIPNIAGVSGIPSMIIHLTALAIGVVFAFICKGKIACFFNNTNVKYSVQEYFYSVK